MISFQTLRREKILAVDGAIGAVHDVYFDDLLWRIRYVVVDTRRWLPGRKVLIAPESFLKDRPWDDGIPVDLTREQIRDSPGFETDLPVSKQNEEALITYYQWAQRFTRTVAPALTAVLPTEPFDVPEGADPGEAQLRSARELIGYVVVGPDGQLGEVDDFRFDRSLWAVRSIEVCPKPQAGLPIVPVPPRRVVSVRWNDRTLVVDLPFGSLAGSGTATSLPGGGPVPPLFDDGTTR